MSESASNPGDAPTPDPLQPPDGPKEIVRHAVGPKDPVGGEPIDAEEERLRQVALAFEAKRIAAKQGLPLHQDQPFEVDARPGPIAAEVTRAAAPLMDKENAAAMVVYEHRKRTNADGSTDEATRLQFNVFAPVVAMCKAIVEFARSSLKGKISFSAKVGKQGAEVEAKAEGSQE